MLLVVAGRNEWPRVQYGPSNATCAVLAFAGAVRPRPSLEWKEVPPVWVSSCSRSSREGLVVRGAEGGSGIWGMQRAACRLPPSPAAVCLSVGVQKGRVCRL